MHGHILRFLKLRKNDIIVSAATFIQKLIISFDMFSGIGLYVMAEDKDESQNWLLPSKFNEDLSASTTHNKFNPRGSTH